MADLVNPYANPYLPAFVNQRPRIDNSIPQPMTPAISSPSFTQIRSASGFEGARSHAMNRMLPGSSDILAEADANIPRIYFVAKDQDNQVIVEGYRLIKEEEPKPVTMDDLNAKMSELLDRMNKLEEENRNGNKPGSGTAWKAPRQQNEPRVSESSRNGAGNGQSAGGNAADATK